MLPSINYTYLLLLLLLLLHLYFSLSLTLCPLSLSLSLHKGNMHRIYKFNKKTTQKSLLLKPISNAAKLRTRTDSELVITTPIVAVKGTQGASCTLAARSIQVHSAYSSPNTARGLNPFMSRSTSTLPLSLSPACLLSPVGLID